LHLINDVIDSFGLDGKGTIDGERTGDIGAVTLILCTCVKEDVQALPERLVITVEPGIYFCNFILDPVLADPELSKYINRSVLDRYWAVGGVRIEDDVHITETGFENLTNTPKI